MVRDVHQPSLAISPLRRTSASFAHPLSPSTSDSRASLSQRPRRAPLFEPEGKENKTPIATNANANANANGPIHSKHAHALNSSTSSAPLPRRFTALDAMTSGRRKPTRRHDADVTTNFAVPDDETLLGNIAPPSDLAGPSTSSLFGSDDHTDTEAPHFFGPRGLAKTGRGGLLTPENSQQVGASLIHH